MSNDLAEREPKQLATIEPTAAQLIQQGLASNAGIDVIERLIALKNSEEDRHAKRAFVASLSAFRENVPPIVKTKLVEFTTTKGTTRYYHAELDKIADTLEVEMRKYQLTFRWTTEPVENGWTRTTCIITHALGHSESASLAGPADQSGGKNPLQAIGSSNSYLQRYTLLLVLGLVARGMDNDGRTEPQADETISAEECQEIVDGLNETRADWDRFKNHFHVGDIAELKTSQLPEARRLIANKRKVQK